MVPQKAAKLPQPTQASNQRRVTALSVCGVSVVGIVSSSCLCGALGKAELEVRDILWAIQGQPLESVESLAQLTAVCKLQGCIPCWPPTTAVTIQAMSRWSYKQLCPLC